MKNSKLTVIILWAFILNTVWEFAQCIYFYDMWSWPFWEATLWMWMAVFGDILIVLGLWKATTLLAPSVHFAEPNTMDYTMLLLISFFAAIFLEWIAIYLELWEYDSFMPTLKILDRQIGLMPILQITFLPALSVYIASKAIILKKL